MNLNKNRGITCVLQHFSTQFAVDTHLLLLIGYHELSIICWETKNNSKQKTLGSFKRQKIVGPSRLATRRHTSNIRLHMRSLISLYRDDLTVKDLYHDNRTINIIDSALVRLHTEHNQHISMIGHKSS